MYWGPPKWPNVSTVFLAAVIALCLYALAAAGFGDVVKIVCFVALFAIPAIAIRRRPDIWRSDLRRRSDRDD